MINRTLADTHIASLTVALSLAVLVSIAGCSGGAAFTPAASYYVDATNGNDANTGTLATAPWKSLGKVSAWTFATDTTIYLKRGETWHEQLDLPSSGVGVDAYDIGALPVIDGSSDIGSVGWAASGGNIYSSIVTLSAGEGLGNVSENGTLLNFVTWNNDCATTMASAAIGAYSYGYPGTVCIKVGTNPNSNNFSYRASKKLYGIRAVGKSNISIKNVQIQRFSLNGVSYEACDTCTVSSVVVKQGGGAVISASPLLYAGNGVECDNACSNILIDHVTVSDIFDSGISAQTSASNQTATNITIQDATVDNAGLAGVEISALSNGGSSGSSLSNVIVSGLAISNSGKGWSGRRNGTEGHGIRIVAESNAGTMSNIQVLDSSISGSAGDGIRLGGEIGAVTITRARVKNNNVGINVADASATSLKLVLTTSLIYRNNSYGVNFDVPFGAGFNLFHNTFYDNTTINFAVPGQLGQARLQNNLFHSSAAMTHLNVASVLLNGVVDNNCYNDQSNMFSYGGIAYSTVAEFAAATAFEANGVGGPLVDLTNAPGEDFTLLPTSQCIASGASGLGIALDYAMHNYASPPSSGAYQF